MNLPASILRAIVARVPAVVPLLKGRARWIVYTSPRKPKWYSDNSYNLVATFDLKTGWYTYYKWDTKTYDYYLRTLERLVTSVYSNQLSGEFVDVMANLISGQINQAFEQGWQDEGDEGEVPEYLTSAAEDMILNQYDYVDQFYKDIIDAKVDETPIEPLLSRAADWAQQWETAYRQAVELIRLDGGGNLRWTKGNSEKGCKTCAALDGIVLSAKEWQELDVHPRGYPNPKLECEGGGPVNNCDCELVPTDQRRTPKGYATVLNIVSR